MKPSADAIWVGEFINSPSFHRETYHRTRYACIEYLTSILLNHFSERRRVLIGFDFPYGYPTGFAKALGLPNRSQPWLAVWAELEKRVQDSAENKNNRFEAAGQLNTIVGYGNSGPFWGCPVGTEIRSLIPQSPGFPFSVPDNDQLKRLRKVEQHLPGVQEAWKLFGAGSVGSQALVGIPYVYRLRRHPKLAQNSRVWPFETQFTSTPCPSEGPSILHAEIWLGVVKAKVQKLMGARSELILDQAQVQAMCMWAAECDQDGTLCHLFDTPSSLSQPEIQLCIEEEGWILGAC